MNIPADINDVVAELREQIGAQAVELAMTRAALSAARRELAAQATDATDAADGA